MCQYLSDLPTRLEEGTSTPDLQLKSSFPALPSHASDNDVSAYMKANSETLTAYMKALLRNRIAACSELHIEVSTELQSYSNVSLTVFSARINAVILPVIYEGSLNTVSDTLE